MKKIIVLSLLLVSFAAVAQATQLSNNAVSTDNMSLFGGVNNTAAEAATNPIIKFSTKVNGLLNTNGAFSTYAILTKHQSGSKTFGTASDSTSIFWRQDAAGTLVNTYSVAPNVSNFSATNAWTAY
ncbi:MAG TPA: hypothetical protein VN642_03730 [Dongiaceae bacterium]|nr:hypothetical protein [Dongiaceae bacterium]